MTRRFSLPRALAALLGLALLPTLAACEVAPATGRTIFTGGLSAEDEARLGYQEHQKIVPQFGGVYAEDAALTAYVQSLGEFLAQTSETPETDFTFTVLDSPIVNAFALPGGYVYVTRGLLALADNEAQLAGVLAHEIGHVTARHSAERYGQTVAANVAGIGLGLLLGSDLASNAFGTAAGLALRSYSREQEHEADLLGIRYLSRAGFDPGAMAGFLAKLEALRRVEAAMEGESADQTSLLSTHPRTADRVARTLEEASVTRVADPIVGRDVYLEKIDGILYGDNPEEGVIRGRRFLHPALRFAFEVPEGFTLRNAPERVTAAGPGESGILFDRVTGRGGVSMTAFLTRVWAEGVNLRDVEAITVNGMEAATGWTRVETRSGPRDLRLVAIRADRDSIYRFLFVSPPEATARLSGPFRETTYSFRRLSPAEVAAIEPQRLRIHRVRAGETVESLAARTPFGKFAATRFRVLNGLPEGAVLQPGDRVKLVVD